MSGEGIFRRWFTLIRAATVRKRFWALFAESEPLPIFRPDGSPSRMRIRMLRRVEILEFRSCRGTVLERLGPVVALLGRNASGKSTILEAIELCARIATAPAGESPLSALRSFPFEASLDFDVENCRFRYSVRVDFDMQQWAAAPLALTEKIMRLDSSGRAQTLLERWPERAVLKGRSEAIHLGRDAPALVAITALLPTAEQPAELLKVRDFLSRVHYYPLDEPLQGSSFEGRLGEGEYRAWVQQRFPSKTANFVRLVLIHLARTNPRGLEDLRGLLGPNGLGFVRHLWVVDEAETKERRPETNTDWDESRYAVMFEQPGEARFVRLGNFGALSFGTRRMIRLLSTLFLHDSGVFLLEQLEDGLHPAMVHKVIHVLRSHADRFQIVLSSHSPMLLNELPPSAVQLITMTEEGIRARGLSDEERASAELYLKDEGSLTEFVEALEE